MYLLHIHYFFIIDELVMSWGLYAYFLSMCRQDYSDNIKRISIEHGML